MAKELGAEQKYDKAMQAGKSGSEGLQWHDPRENPFRLSGFPFIETDGIYRRMPVNLPEPLPPSVDSLANYSAGGQIAFKTNSREVAIRFTLTERGPMPHMPTTGMGGFDIYLGAPGERRFLDCTKYDPGSAVADIRILKQENPVERECLINMPLYQGVEEVLIGLEPEAVLEAPAAYVTDKPIIWYGTSITQGGCASRPGSCPTNSLSRRLNMHIHNLGFSGSGRGEPEVARCIALIPDPAMFILDYEANTHSVESWAETLPVFMNILRESHADVPILVMSRIMWSWEFIPDTWDARRDEAVEAARSVVESMRAAGDSNVHFMDTCEGVDELFGEGTVDGCHPTDLGFYLMTNIYEPVVRKILADRVPGVKE